MLFVFSFFSFSFMQKQQVPNCARQKAPMATLSRLQAAHANKIVPMPAAHANKIVKSVPMLLAC
jgi:hypothetical protein